MAILAPRSASHAFKRLKTLSVRSDLPPKKYIVALIRIAEERGEEFVGDGVE